MKKSAQWSLFIFLVSSLSFLGTRLILGEWFPFMYGILIVIVLSLFLSFVFDRAFYKRILCSTSFLAFQKLCLRFVVLLLIFILGMKILDNARFRWDLSTSQLNSLSEQTESFLKTYDKEVKIYAFFQKSDNKLLRDSFAKLCSLFVDKSESISCEIVDPQIRPDLAEKWKINSSPIVILDSENANLSLHQWSEEKIANALLRLKQNIQSQICFTQSNSEIPLSFEGDYGLSFFAEVLKSAGLRTRALDSITELSLQGCDVLAILGPKQEFSVESMNLLKAYVAKSGSLLLAIDPGRKHRLNLFLKDYGIRFFNDFIIDLDAENLGLGPANAIGVQWNSQHEITRQLKNTKAVFPVASRFELEEVDTWKSVVLVSTSESAFTKPGLSDSIEFKLGRDSEGAMSLAVVAENLESNSKIIAVSDSDFLSNQFLALQSNQYFALSLFEYLIKSKEEFHLPLKSLFRDVFIFTPSKAKMYLIFFVLPIGFVFLSLSIWVWVRRRQMR